MNSVRFSVALVYASQVFAVFLFLMVWVNPAEAYYAASSNDIEKTLSKTLAERGLGKDIEAHLIGNYGDAAFKSQTPITITVNSIDIQEQTQRFSATIWFADNSATEKNTNNSSTNILGSLEVNGRYDSYVNIPVANRRIRREDVITESDITWLRWPETKLRPDMMTDSANIIGYSPKRGLSANRPIRVDEIASPVVISKGDAVTMIVKTNSMEISALGTAMNAGGVGEMISLRNMDSNTEVHGRVIRQGVVEIPLGGQFSQTRSALLRDTNSPINLSDGRM